MEEERIYLVTHETHDDVTAYIPFKEYSKAYEYAKNAEKDFIKDYDPSQDMDNVVVQVEEKVEKRIGTKPLSVVPYGSKIEIAKGGGEYFDHDTDPYCYIQIHNLKVE